MNEELEVMNPHKPKTRRPFSLRASLQRFALEGAVLVAIYVGVTAFQTRNLIEVQEPVPAFALQTTEGTKVTEKDLLGKKTVLTFWAPWCTVCTLESDTLSDLHNDTLKDPKTQVLSIVLSYEDLNAVHAFTKEHEATYPVLLGNRSISKAFRISSFPTTYIIDENGEIEHQMVGYTTEAGIRARLML